MFVSLLLRQADQRPVVRLKPTSTATIRSARRPKGPYLERTTKVGSYAPNKLGLYDMHGNVWQWCEDTNAQWEDHRVIRGSPVDNAQRCSAAVRLKDVPEARNCNLGFRLARTALPGQAPARRPYPRTHGASGERPSGKEQGADPAPMPPDAQPLDENAVNVLIGKLGSNDFEEREQAVGQLIRCGPGALAALAIAKASKDPEVVGAGATFHRGDQERRRGSAAGPPAAHAQG